MLQPIKATQATQATKPTEAGEATESVRPISEQRPGQTLRDRLYELPVISGQKKSAVASGSGQSPTLYQSYSVAKSLPATPITPLPSAAPGSTFSNFANKFTSYADYWAGLGAFQKPEAQKEFVADKWGTAYIDPSLKPYMEKYGLERGVGFLESLAKADKLQANRQNPFFQPIVNKADVYAGEYSNIMRQQYTGGDGKYRRMPQEYDLTKEEVSSLRKIAEDYGLGDTGYSELLSKTYSRKFLESTTNKAMAAVDILNNPYEANWNQVRKDFLIPETVSFSKIIQDAKEESGSSDGGDVKEGGLQKLIGLWNTVDAIKGFAEPAYQTYEWAEYLGGAPSDAFPWVKFALHAAGMYAQEKERRVEKYFDKNIGIFTPDGRLRTKFSDFSSSERDALDEMYAAVKDNFNSRDDFAKAFSSAAISSLYKNLVKYQGAADSAQKNLDSDSVLQWGDSGPSLRK